MNIKTAKRICITYLAFLLIFYPTKIEALTHEWISVPKSEYGEQLWDKKNVKKNQDGFIRVLSKFIPKSTTEITQNILYTMDINCSEKSFKDVAVSAKDFKDSRIMIPSGKIQIEMS